MLTAEQLETPQVRRSLVLEFMKPAVFGPRTQQRRTGWRTFRENGERHRIRAEFGFHIIGEQEPYFSITVEVERQAGSGVWMEDRGGCCHDDVAKHFHALRPLIRWHLASAEAGPMHYAANAAYFLDFVYDWSEWARESWSPDPLEAFKGTAVFGAVEGDRVPGADDDVAAWCAARFPALMRAFYRDLATFHHVHAEEYWPDRGA